MIVRRHPTLLSLTAVVAAGAMWFGLAAATGLIFHLMPAAPSIAGAWVLTRRRVGLGSQLTSAAILLFGALAASGVAVILAVQNLPLDEPWVTALVIGAGVLIGARLLVRHQPGGREVTAT